MISIKDMRTEKGLTLKELGELTGIKYQLLHRYEKGETKITLERYLFLAKSMGYEVTTKKV